MPLIDRWDTYCNDTMSTLALKANVFYDIKMEYKQIIGNAFARLFWASASVTKELIPSSQFYYETQTQKSPFGLIISPNAATGIESIASGKGGCNYCIAFFDPGTFTHLTAITLRSTGITIATAGTASTLTIQVQRSWFHHPVTGGHFTRQCSELIMTLHLFILRMPPPRLMITPTALAHTHKLFGSPDTFLSRCESCQSENFRKPSIWSM